LRRYAYQRSAGEDCKDVVSDDFHKFSAILLNDGEAYVLHHFDQGKEMQNSFGLADAGKS